MNGRIDAARNIPNKFKGVIMIHEFKGSSYAVKSEVYENIWASIGHFSRWFLVGQYWYSILSACHFFLVRNT